MADPFDTERGEFTLADDETGVVGEDEERAESAFESAPPLGALEGDVGASYGWADEPGSAANWPLGSGYCCCCVAADGQAYPVYGYDTNGDGVADAAALDGDGDGVVDTWYVDTDGDGVFDEIRDSSGAVIGQPQVTSERPTPTDVQAVPPDGYQPNVADGVVGYPAPAGADGQAQMTIHLPGGEYIQLPAIDSNGDGVADAAAFDQNQDGTPDIFWVDSNGDLVADTMLFDGNADGRPDTFTDPSQSGNWSPIDGATAQPQPPTEAAPATSQPEVGGVAGAWGEVAPGEPLPSDNPALVAAAVIDRIHATPGWESNPKLVQLATDMQKMIDMWTQMQERTIGPWLDESNAPSPADGGQPDTAQGEPEATQTAYPGAGGLPEDIALTPDGSLPDWYRDIEWAQTQSVSGFCVPVSVGIVISEMTGEVHGEAELVAAAVTAGLLEQNPDGTWSGMSAEGAEDLLEHFGVPAHVEHNVSFEQVDAWIAEGRHVLVGVDADEVWRDSDDDLVPDDKGPDHALVVKEIDEARGVVILFDPGDPNVPIREIPIAKFADAWEDGNNEAIVTDVSSVGTRDLVTGPPPTDEPSPQPAPTETAPTPVADAQTPVQTPFARSGGDAVGEGGDDGIGLEDAAGAARLAPAVGLVLLAVYLGKGSTSLGRVQTRTGQ